MTGSECVPALKALSDETRLRILRLLSKSSLTVGEIAERLDVAAYNVSKHLKILQEAKLLEVSRQGKQRYYSIPEKFYNQLKASNGVLDLGCCTFRFDRLPK